MSYRFEISFQSKWPIWKPYRFALHFASIHVNTSRELTEHQSEIFNRNEISYGFEFISPLMWTYSMARKNQFLLFTDFKTNYRKLQNTKKVLGKFQSLPSFNITSGFWQNLKQVSRWLRHGKKNFGKFQCQPRFSENVFLILFLISISSDFLIISMYIYIYIYI